MSTTTGPATRRLAPPESPRIVLEDVPWALYEQLRAVDANRNIRMTYDDGTLELMSPLYRHEKYAGRLAKVVMAVVGVLGIPCLESRSTTFCRREGEGPNQGKATEPDTSFYIAKEAIVRDKDKIDLERDPPPDLAIEVDETTSSKSKLPLYAALGVPEVWRYRADSETLWFGRLGEDGDYHDCDRSPNLPMLTPERVLDWLQRAEGLAESQWFMQLLEWVRAEILLEDVGR